jgi:hypothetical protein
MGFFNFLRKEKSNYRTHSDKMNDSSIDNQAISALSLAYIKLDDKLGLKSTGRCGILVKDIDIPEFSNMKQYINNFLSNVSDKQKIGWDFTYQSLVDNYGYLWYILDGNAIEDIVVAINAIGDTIHEKGFSKQLLAAIFEFTSGYSVNSNRIENSNLSNNNNNNNNKNQYLIYNYKIDKFYPFVPIISSLDNIKNDLGEKKGINRNHEQELKIVEQIKDDILIEKDSKLWYPIWKIPF